MKGNSFLKGREIGIINVGNTKVIADGEEYTLIIKMPYTWGRGTKEVVLKSVNENNLKFYFNSSLAQISYPSVLIKKEKAVQTTMGFFRKLEFTKYP